jgi:hypothetical protein
VYGESFSVANLAARSSVTGASLAMGRDSSKLDSYWSNH